MRFGRTLSNKNSGSSRFGKGYWGRIDSLQMPNFLFRSKLAEAPKLSLEPSALKVLLVIFQVAYRKKRIHGQDLILTITTDSLIRMTGYSKNIITAGIDELCEKLYLRREGGSSAPSD